MQGADNPWRGHGPVLGFGPWVHRRNPAGNLVGLRRATACADRCLALSGNVLSAACGLLHARRALSVLVFPRGSGHAVLTPPGMGGSPPQQLSRGEYVAARLLTFLLRSCLALVATGHSDKHPPAGPQAQQQQQQQAGLGDAVPTVPVVAAEAGVVVSGGSRVCRPRWVVHQSLSSLASSSFDGEEEAAVPLAGAEAEEGSEAQRAATPVAAGVAVGGAAQALADRKDEEAAGVAALPRRPARKSGSQRPAAAAG